MSKQCAFRHNSHLLSPTPPLPSPMGLLPSPPLPPPPHHVYSLLLPSLPLLTSRSAPFSSLFSLCRAGRRSGCFALLGFLSVWRHCTKSLQHDDTHASNKPSSRTTPLGPPRQWVPRVFRNPAHDASWRHCTESLQRVTQASNRLS